ncbi:MAG TPA: radical SAM family heme chaperone HemW [Anaerolineaceae bacterium]|nr:radical SAM family heme chaperone HemW [Anaerolineaceae bacterium]
MFGIYLHIPFCRRRCNYCDFITYAGKDELMPGYYAALMSELQHQAATLQDLPNQVETIFFGGGTPSLLKVEWIEALIDCVRSEYGLADKAEISLEANPGTLSPEYIARLLEAGVNRLSIGVQSFIKRDLALLGRIHNPFQASDAILSARRVGFTNISLDLIFGIPGQSLADWQANLQQAVALRPDHLSLYSLILEPGTRLYDDVQAGKIQPVSEDLSADMYELAMDTLVQEGFSHYEISNWARGEAFEAKHNKIYWKNQPYLGVGAGAYGSLNGVRVANTPSIEDYIHKISDLRSNGKGTFPAAVETIKLDPYTVQQETMMLGMRLTREGVSDFEFRNRFGEAIQDVFSKEVKRIIARKLAEWGNFPDGPHLVLTRGGALLGNQVFQEFV